jgi:hypothetical protein
MKRLFLAIILLLFLSNPSFGYEGDFDRALEIHAGFSSPGKGLFGVRFYPFQLLSVGVILGTIPAFGYVDAALAYSIHFTGTGGIYAFQSFHWLNADKTGNTLEFDTGAGYQILFLKKFLGYGEFGIPLYYNNGFYRHYEEGIPRNRVSHKDQAMFSIRLGLGVGYLFEL